MKKSTKIMIVAGEASGDAHAAKLVSALRGIEPEADFEFFGAAGPKMREAGVEATVESDALSIVGLAEIGRALPMFLRAFKALKRQAELRKPDAVILVDFPEFNLKLAKLLKKKGYKVIYYISPQLWAWRKYRISTVKKYVDLMITILPFEEEWYAKNGVSHVKYVGSPLAREVYSTVSKANFCMENSIDAAEPIVALLPGSRHKEIVRILPVMINAAAEIAGANPKSQFLIGAQDERNGADIERLVSTISKRSSRPSRFKILIGKTYDLLNAADAAAVASGTATLEAAIIGTPLVVVYKTSELNYRLFEPMIDVPHYGLVNLIAGYRLAAELIQHKFTPKSMAAEMLRLLEPGENAGMREKLKEAASRLGQGGASKRAAGVILNTLGAGPNSMKNED